MQTECNTDRFDLQPLEKREVRGSFDGGNITSDAGALLLREVEVKMGILGRFAGCFTDHCNPELIEHPVDHLIAQRVYGLAPGYEDLNDHVEEGWRRILLTAQFGAGSLGVRLRVWWIRSSSNWQHQDRSHHPSRGSDLRVY